MIPSITFFTIMHVEHGNVMVWMVNVKERMYMVNVYGRTLYNIIHLSCYSSAAIR